jgi:2-polyprenyl-3-methyl-5-hydroxy-6-metoxy-1,4-benzoquinol methylase
MNKDYWNGIAENYESEIFSVLADDKENLVTKNIKNFGAESKVAIDLGCGIGYFLPFLSKSFGKVHAVDFSEKCLQQARKNSENINGIEYWCEDMSSPKNLIPKADFILSINSVISQSITVRSGIFKSIYKLLKTGGHLLLVVPSLESSLFSDYKHIEWNLKNGHRPSNAVQAGFSHHKSNQIHQGVREIGGTATKLYLKEELISIFSSLGFKVCEISKIEYAWTTEFDNPPRWMKDLYPWDWFLLAKKI